MPWLTADTRQQAARDDRVHVARAIFVLQTDRTSVAVMVGSHLLVGVYVCTAFNELLN